MIHLAIPGFGEHELHALVFDYNGTLAIDGSLIPNVANKIRSLAFHLEIHILTADTFGSATEELRGLPCKLTFVSVKGQDAVKRDYVQGLGAEKCVCIGNGRNDREMLRVAALGIAVIQREGASIETISAADIICTDVLDAFGLLENPRRLMATLRC